MTSSCFVLFHKKNHTVDTLLGFILPITRERLATQHDEDIRRETSSTEENMAPVRVNGRRKFNAPPPPSPPAPPVPPLGSSRPVPSQDFVKPFPDKIPWSEFSFSFPAEEASHIMDTLRAVPEKTLAQMQVGDVVFKDGPTNHYYYCRYIEYSIPYCGVSLPPPLL